MAGGQREPGRRHAQISRRANFQRGATRRILGFAHPGLGGEQRGIGIALAERAHTLAAPPDRLPARQQTRHVLNRVGAAPGRCELAREFDRRRVGWVKAYIFEEARKRFENLPRLVEAETFDHRLSC